MPAEAITAIGVVLAGLFGFLVNLAANKRQQRADQHTATLGMAQLNHTAETEFRNTIMTELKETRAELKLTSEKLNEKINAQGIQIAELTGKIKVLEGSESHLKTEVVRLTTENTMLKSKNSELNDENEIQGQEIAKLNGRLSVYETQAPPPAQVQTP